MRVAGVQRPLRSERDRGMRDGRGRDANTVHAGRDPAMILSDNRDLPLALSEGRVKGLVRPVSQDDGNSSSGEGVVVRASPAGGLLPIW